MTKERHITVHPVHDDMHPNETRFQVAEAPIGGDDIPTRTYGRLDAAVAKAWTLSKRKGIPLIISIHPGRPMGYLSSMRMENRNE